MSVRVRTLLRQGRVRGLKVILRITGETEVFTNLTEAEMGAKQRELLDRKRQLEIEQQALDAAIEARGYDGATL